MRRLRVRGAAAAPPAADGPRVLVDPAAVAHTIRQPELWRSGAPRRPGVHPGNWDLLMRPFEETALFRACRARLCEGRAWQDTEYWRRLAQEHPLRHRKFGSPEAYFAHYDALFAAIVRNGYDNRPEVPPVQVHIGRNGDLIRHDGSHRLAAARLLGVRAVAVHAFLIHPEAPYRLEDYAVEEAGTL